MKLDHFFVLTEPFAHEGDALVKLGLREGTPNTHPGQGTANRRFFFSNTALELLYVRDAMEAAEGPAKDLRFPARASNADASPFGVVVRSDSVSEQPPFAGWYYQPVYFSQGSAFLVGENSDQLEELLCICMPDVLPTATPQLRSAAPFLEVTALRLHVPASRPSSILEALSLVQGIEVVLNNPHHLEIVFGGGVAGERRDLRPALPLQIQW